MLKIFRQDVEVRHMISHDQKSAIKVLGRLDAQLRRLDLFMLSVSASSPAENLQSTEWLRNIVSEWLALAISTSAPSHDLKSIELRLSHLNAILEATLRRGSPIGVAPEGHRDLMTAVAQERGPSMRVVRSCEALFTAVH